MIVEDEPNIGSLVRTYLQRAGYGVVWVRSGEQALTELPVTRSASSCSISACRGSTASKSAAGSAEPCR